MKYFLAHNEIDVFHYGELKDEQFVETGQPILLFFETEQELIDKLQEYNVEYNTNTSIELGLESPPMEDVEDIDYIDESN
jgi:hypothetical protein